MEEKELVQNSKLFDQLANEYGLVFLVLFGSAAKNTLKEKSDVDIAFLSKIMR